MAVGATMTGTPVNVSSSVGTTASRIDVLNQRGKRCFARGMELSNTHAAQDLLVSFDDGTTFFTQKAGVQKTWPGNFDHFVVKGSGAGTTFEAVLATAS